MTHSPNSQPHKNTALPLYRTPSQLTDILKNSQGSRINSYDLLVVKTKI